MSYEHWIANVHEHLAKRQLRLSRYVALTNLHAVYETGCTPRDGMWMVLEVATRHGNEDAKQLIKRNEKLFG